MASSSRGREPRSGQAQRHGRNQLRQIGDDGFTRTEIEHEGDTCTGERFDVLGANGIRRVAQTVRMNAVGIVMKAAHGARDGWRGARGGGATISVARFWAAGLARSGGSALDGLARTVGAALLLPIWPWVFHTAVALANDASTGLLGSGSVTKSSANLLAVGVGAGWAWDLSAWGCSRAS